MQRNVSHLVQVRTPQGLKLYRLASPSTTTTSPANTNLAANSVQTQLAQQQRLVLSQQQAAVTTGAPNSQQPPVAEIPKIHNPNDEETVIVRNSDGRYVQMPRSLLKKLITSGQFKQNQPNVEAGAQVSTPASQQQHAQVTQQPNTRITSNDVLNMLPTVPVRQEHLQHD